MHLIFRFRLANFCSSHSPPLLLLWFGLKLESLSCFAGILTGKGDHYTHNNTAYIDGHILNGYDFWKNHDPDFSADGHYSTFLYQDRINQLIDDHDRSKVCVKFIVVSGYTAGLYTLMLYLHFCSTKGRE